MSGFLDSQVPTQAGGIAGAGEFCQTTGPPDITPLGDGSHHAENPCDSHQSPNSIGNLAHLKLEGQ